MLSKWLNIGALFLCIVSIASFSSCKKFLEMPLRDKVPQESLFQDEQGFMDALTGVYLAMDKPSSGAIKGLYTQDLTMGMLSVMVNNYPNASSSTLGDNLYANAYRYDYAQDGVKSEIKNIWSALYKNIANINNLLEHVDGKRTDFSRDHYYKVKGEAIALRALFHFDLARLFGQPPVLGLDKRAIPYVKSFSAKVTPFATLRSVLDSCISDLTIAKDLLAQGDTTAIQDGAVDLFSGYTQNHMNYWATNALLARVYLYKGDHIRAMQAAQAVVGSTKFPLSTSNVAVATANVRDRLFSAELIFSVYSSNVIKNNDGMFNVATGTPLQLPLASRNAIYGTTAPLDWRLSWFDGNVKGTLVPSKFFQDTNLPYKLQNIVPVIRVSELYYIMAECAQAAGDLEQGLLYLNQVRVARGLNPLTRAEVPDTVALALEISKEYRKEFIQEGQTFFYYKRLNKDLKQETGTTVTIPADAYVFPIPDKEVENNPS